MCFASVSYKAVACPFILLTALCRANIFNFDKVQFVVCFYIYHFIISVLLVPCLITLCLNLGHKYIYIYIFPKYLELHITCFELWVIFKSFFYKVWILDEDSYFLKWMFFYKDNSFPFNYFVLSKLNSPYLYRSISAFDLSQKSEKRCVGLFLDFLFYSVINLYVIFSLTDHLKSDVDFKMFFSK